MVLTTDTLYTIPDFYTFSYYKYLTVYAIYCGNRVKIEHYQDEIRHQWLNSPCLL